MSLLKDKQVFNGLLLMLTFFRFKNNTLRQIFKYFEKFFSSQNILITLDQNAA